MNGSNDISKGIATLVGSGVSDYRRAILWGTGWTVAGTLVAAWFSQAMVDTFARGIVNPQFHPFLVAVLIGAGGWVLFASKTGLPVSTTHAITSALCGAAVAAYGWQGVSWASVTRKVAVPLLLSPAVAMAAVWGLFPFLQQWLARLGNTCACSDPRPVQTVISNVPGSGSLFGAAALQIPQLVVDQFEACRNRGVEALGIQLDNLLHWLSSGLTSFARGLNDGPKMTALGLSAAMALKLDSLGLFVLVSSGMGFGCMVAGRRVTETLAEKITRMTPAEGLSANLITGTLVVVASHWGIPVSTTHVSSSAIIGLGLRRPGHLSVGTRSVRSLRRGSSHFLSPPAWRLAVCGSSRQFSRLASRVSVAKPGKGLLPMRTTSDRTDVQMIAARGAFARFTSLLALFGFLVPPVSAQTSDGQIVGTVYDSSRAVVPNAVVTILDDRTSAERTVSANAQGYFVAAQLRASTYTITVNAAGFEPSTRTITLGVGQTHTLEFIVNPAGNKAEITVTDRVSVDTSSARVGVNVTPAEVKRLPLNGRQVSQLYLLAPGAVNSGTGTFDNIRFSGRANQQNAIRFDGVEGSSIIDASPGNLSGEISSPFRLQSSLENIQEFRVDSNTYTAEFGTGTGGQISVITKSGSNEFHGSLFEYLRNDALDARNFFDQEEKSILRLNQFGGSAGGPVIRNRTFFFASYEGNRQRAGINSLEAVPSEAARSRAVPAIVPLVAAFPRGSFKTADPDFDLAFLQSQSVITENAFGLRLDHKVNDRHSFYARYFRQQGASDEPEGVTGRRAVVRVQPQNAVLAWQQIWTPAMLNEFKVGYNGAWTRVNAAAPVVPGIDLSAITLNLAGSVANAGIAGQGASAGVAVPGGLLRQNSASNGRRQLTTPYAISFIDNLSWVKGQHHARFGLEARPVRMYLDRQGGTTYTFPNLSAFLNNAPSMIAFSGDLSQPSKFNGGLAGTRQTRQEYYIGYAQDEWKARPNLTFTYGLRYEYYTPLRERNGRAVVFDPGAGGILPPGTPFYRTSKRNFLPRLAMAWSPSFLKDKTVIRWGFGLNVGPGQSEDLIQPIESDRVSITRTGGAFPIDPAELIARFDVNDLRDYQPRAFDRGYRPPEQIAQWNLSIQQELPSQILLSAAYVGSLGRHLFNRTLTNLITEVTTHPSSGAAIITRRFGSRFAEVDVKASNATDNYNALQLTLSRRLSSGLTLGSQWTWAHSLGTSAGSNEAQTQSNPFDLKADYGNNNFDVRHSFSASALYDLPFGAGGRWKLSGTADAILGGWQIGGVVNARTGLPIDLRITRPDVIYRNNFTGAVTLSPLVVGGMAVTTAIINVPGGGASRNVRRPDVVPGVNPFLKMSNLTFLNPAAFATPQPGSFGNYARNTLHGSGLAQFDLTLARRIEVQEGKHLEFRAEVYNVLNRANFANPVGQLPAALGVAPNQLQPGEPFSSSVAGAGTFGLIHSTVGRGVGLGTNRQIQLSLRLNF